MKIEQGTGVFVSVRLEWANLWGVRAFLRGKYDPTQEIRAIDDSHIIAAEVVDAEDPLGLWILIDYPTKTGELEKRKFLIPWAQILTVMIRERAEEPENTTIH